MLTVSLTEMDVLLLEALAPKQVVDDQVDRTAGIRTALVKWLEPVDIQRKQRLRL